MFLFRLQIYKKVSNLAIPRNGDAPVYRFLGIEDILKLRTFAPEIEKERGDDCHSRAAELRNSLSSQIGFKEILGL